MKGNKVHFCIDKAKVVLKEVVLINLGLFLVHVFIRKEIFFLRFGGELKFSFQ